MKKLVLFLAIGIGTLSAHAQSLAIGAEAGLNITNVQTELGGVSGSTTSLAGLKVGGVADIGFSRLISLQPGLFFSMKGAKDDYSDVSEAGGTTVTNYDNFKFRLNYLEIPINVQFKFAYNGSGHFFAGAGPYFAFALSGKVTHESGTRTVHSNGSVTSTGNTESSSLHIGNDAATDDVKGSDVGLNINLGYQFRGGLFVRGNAGIGMENIMPGGDANNYMRNNSFTLSLGYMF